VVDAISFFFTAEFAENAEFFNFSSFSALLALSAVNFFHSGDLSTSESWHKASGYSVRIAECMGGGLTTPYTNLFVKAYDLDLDRDRFFTNGVAVPLAYHKWSYHSHDWWGSTNFPTNHVIREVHVDLWGLMADGSYLNGGVYLDDVVPVMPIYVDDDGGGPERGRKLGTSV